jgi:DNA-directed RNA polymerase subunit RPC12/RpoP
MPDDLPIAKPVNTQPPAGRKFPCPSCGARLDFDPSVRGLKCPYCGFEQKIEREADGEIAEKAYAEYMDREEALGKAIPGRSSETRCPGCGANVLLEDNIATEKCPFCATHLENKPEAVHAMIPPESVLPFRVDLRGAREAFTHWLGNLWFAPTELNKIATLGEFSGVYLPYWTYDAMTNTFYEGERGENYTVQEQYTDTDAQGNRVTRTRAVTYTNWYPVSGEVRHFFDDTLICGSKSLPEDLIDDQGGWPLDKLEPFRPEYLSGFRTERYAIGLKEGFRNAKVRMESEIRGLVRRDIGGDAQRVHNQQTRYSAVTFKPLLLPLWVAVYRYREKTFQLLVNGCTGRVSGYRPWSAMKIARLVVLILLAILLVFLMVNSMNR